MLRTRIIPALLLQEGSLVKTVRFSRPSYIGDPVNTVRIFNELEVDELMFLDIGATREGRGPNLGVLSQIADECFMPLGYGGGIRSVDDAKSVFDIGFEKIAINSAAVANPKLIEDLASHYGTQAVIVSMDARRRRFGRGYIVRTHSARVSTKIEPVAWAKEAERRGAGEILLTSIDREGTWSGFDIDLVRAVSDAVNVPVIAHGGAGRIDHIVEVVTRGGASAVCLGSMMVFQRQGMGVLVNFPDRAELEARLG